MESDLGGASRRAPDPDHLSFLPLGTGQRTSPSRQRNSRQCPACRPSSPRRTFPVHEKGPFGSGPSRTQTACTARWSDLLRSAGRRDSHLEPLNRGQSRDRYAEGIVRRLVVHRPRVKHRVHRRQQASWCSPPVGRRGRYTQGTLRGRFKLNNTTNKFFTACDGRRQLRGREITVSRSLPQPLSEPLKLRTACGRQGESRLPGLEREGREQVINQVHCRFSENETPAGIIV